MRMCPRCGNTNVNAAWDCDNPKCERNLPSKKLKEIKEFVLIAGYKIPKKLFDEYVQWQIQADGYLDKSISVPSNTDYERTMRWQSCVQKVMELHRQICKSVNVEYSEDFDDIFYRALKKEQREKARMRG